MIANLAVVDNWKEGGLAGGQTALYLSRFLYVCAVMDIIYIFSEVLLCIYATARRASRWRSTLSDLLQN
ncbi:hypothetical protein A2837_02670 [Candidatus Kaiserbacteria bacterium RIFCSPHIGHO2_01_FULL_46_22]|uniref:Uncharacterized protein n=1 Tax=Candidatus Kaiserbacteria bacterium RIFCSPHIGHO2_01_FULL_46_22 TaxID=1798475 RepID=A0A1F6BWS2_9BACT|nr:MAG: hypothetical protein A2837_02670 [Candidatus Kaiserbacteria bacterium RIFCSPHIGHO2_01_FULL_46_22]